MKRRLKRLLILLCSLTLLLSMPMTVYANEDSAAEESGGDSESSDKKYEGALYTQAAPNAIDEILKDERFDGAVEQIQWLTKWFDQFSVQVISVCAFLIIAAAFLKNALAGAYCANSKFWDKVADAHAKKDALNLSMIKGYFQGGQYQNTTIAGFKDGILALLPNIKAFTDFDDADIQPKQYFMKSIPQMCMCVIIGIFIYNGYYRDTAAVVGEFGSEAFNRVMTAASPSEVLDKLTQTTGMPALLTDGLTDTQGKILNKIADAGRKACITEFSLTSTAQKIRISAQVENWVLHGSGIQEWVEKHCQDEENNAWKVSAKVKLVPAASNNVDELSQDDENATTHVKVFMTDQPVTELGKDTDDAWIFDSTEAAKTEKQMLYLRVVLTAVQTESTGGKNKGKPVTGENDGGSVKPTWGDDVDIHLTVDTSSSKTDFDVTGQLSDYTITAPSNTAGSTLELTYDKNTGKIILHLPSGFTTGSKALNAKTYHTDGSKMKHHIILHVNE